MTGYVPLRRGAGRLFDQNLNQMLSQIFTGGAVFETSTATAISDAGDALNTTNKTVGRPVWDTTNNRLMVASGDGATDPWYIADGSSSVTPA